MKTLADKITELKLREETTWLNYCHAVEKEVNALLKRMGDDKGVTFSVANHSYEQARKNGELSFKDSPLLANIVNVVKHFDYIIKLRDKWIEASAQLYKVKRALEAE